MKKLVSFLTAGAMLIAVQNASAAAMSRFVKYVKSAEAAAQAAPLQQFYFFAAVIQPMNPALASPSDDDVEGGSENVLNSPTIRIINLGKVINHEGVDYAPTVSADGKTLYYVSERNGGKVHPNGKASHDFWASKKNASLDTNFSDPFNIDPDSKGDLAVNTELNEGAASIAADRQTLVFTGCNRPDGLGSCDLYITEIDGDKWGKPRNLGRNVNSPNWDSQPSIAPDKSRIYFVSNRPGPNGSDNFDIWYSDYDLDTEDWKPAVNIGAPINTEGKERSPFIAADNQTLFFASDSHEPNLGGTDFYVTDVDNGKWSKPKHLGNKLNTAEDEEFITLPASGDVVYFSSRRGDIKGFQGNLDVFMAFVPSFFKATILTGVVLDECTEANIPASITVRNPVTGKVFKDTLNTTSKKQFELLISNTDYGNPKDSIKVLKMEITASNPKYGETKKIVEIEKPKKTRDKSASQQSLEINTVLKLGQRPVLSAEMDFADYIKRAGKKNPELASWKGLVMEEVATRELYPLLNFVFFDEGAAEIPKRYILFKNQNQVAAFDDEKIPGGTLEKYYNVLNIYGFRLKKYPKIKVKIDGCYDNNTPQEKSKELAQKRADVVYEYLNKVWGIEAERMTKAAVGYPTSIPSKTSDRDPQSIAYSHVENRRTELNFVGDPEEVWQVMRPILNVDPKITPSPETMNFMLQNGIEDELIASRRIVVTKDGQPWNTLENVGLTDASFKWNWKNKADDELAESVLDDKSFSAKLIIKSKNGTECESDPITIKVKIVKASDFLVVKTDRETKERYNLILFPFNKYDAGPFNERILKEYVYPRAQETSKVFVEGHTDVVGMFDANQKLSGNRSNAVKTAVNSHTKGKYQLLESVGVGEEQPLFNNELPEGRMYNRTVQININTPIID